VLQDTEREPLLFMIAPVYNEATATLSASLSRSPAIPFDAQVTRNVIDKEDRHDA
jgi:hypothetical protein